MLLVPRGGPAGGKLEAQYSVNDSMNMFFGERQSNFNFPITTTNDGGLNFANTSKNAKKASQAVDNESGGDYEGD